MIWFKINKRFWIDLTQIREFGTPIDENRTVLITFKDGTSEKYGVEDAAETMARFEEAIQKLYEPLRPIIPDEGELPYGLV